MAKRGVQWMCECVGLWRWWCDVVWGGHDSAGAGDEKGFVIACKQTYCEMSSMLSQLIWTTFQVHFYSQHNGRMNRQGVCWAGSIGSGCQDLTVPLLQLMHQVPSPRQASALGSCCACTTRDLACRVYEHHILLCKVAGQTLYPPPSTLTPLPCLQRPATGCCHLHQ